MFSSLIELNLDKSATFDSEESVIGLANLLASAPCLKKLLTAGQ